MSLIITVGAPGSGKSTWADKALPKHYLRLERDRFREALFGARKSYWDHPFPKDSKSLVVTDSMMGAMRSWPSRHWAVTDTGLLYGAVSPFITFACTRGVAVEVLVFERPAAYLRKLNKNRQGAHQVPEALLDDMIANMDDPTAWWKQPREGFTISHIDPYDL